MGLKLLNNIKKIKNKKGILLNEIIPILVFIVIAIAVGGAVYYILKTNGIL